MMYVDYNRVIRDFQEKIRKRDGTIAALRAEVERLEKALREAEKESDKWEQEYRSVT